MKENDIKEDEINKKAANGCGCGCNSDNSNKSSCGCESDNSNESSCGCESDHSNESSCGCEGNSSCDSACDCEDVASEKANEDNIFKSKSKGKKSKVQTELDDLKVEYEKMQNFALRTKADLENIRKRNENIARDMYLDGKTETLVGMLPVLDSINRALTIEMPESILDGISKIKKQFDMLFEKMGVTEIAALDEDFNPNFHTALMQVDDEEKSGKCTQVFENGYMFKDKILRHASVVVAK